MQHGDRNVLGEDVYAERRPLPVMLLELIGFDAICGGTFLAPRRSPYPRALQHGVRVHRVEPGSRRLPPPRRGIGPGAARPPSPTSTGRDMARFGRRCWPRCATPGGGITRCSCGRTGCWSAIWNASRLRRGATCDGADRRQRSLASRNARHSSSSLRARDRTPAASGSRKSSTSIDAARASPGRGSPPPGRPCGRLGYCVSAFVRESRVASTSCFASPVKALPIDDGG